MLQEKDKERILRDWIDNYADEMYQRAKYKTSSDEIAKDLLQDTLLAAYQGLQKNANDYPQNEKAWLLQILNHKIIDFYRKNSSYEKKHRVFVENTLNWYFDRNGHWKHNLEIDNNLLEEYLEECLELLPPKYNWTIRAKFLLNKKTDIICKELEISLSNFWQTIHRAKLLLRKCIANYSK
ncbi:MAG: RNA polymerase sigma factor [Cytophagales bacterium]|nr:RNA polymerase sigma factor [Cytophagales bacterium]